MASQTPNQEQSKQSNANQAPTKSELTAQSQKQRIYQEHSAKLYEKCIDAKSDQPKAKGILDLLEYHNPELKVELQNFRDIFEKHIKDNFSEQEYICPAHSHIPETIKSHLTVLSSLIPGSKEYQSTIDMMLIPLGKLHDGRVVWGGYWGWLYFSDPDFYIYTKNSKTKTPHETIKNVNMTIVNLLSAQTNILDLFIKILRDYLENNYDKYVFHLNLTTIIQMICIICLNILIIFRFNNKKILHRINFQSSMDHTMCFIQGPLFQIFVAAKNWFEDIVTFSIKYCGQGYLLEMLDIDLRDIQLSVYAFSEKPKPKPNKTKKANKTEKADAT